MAMFHLLKIRTSIYIFKNEKCKVTFGLEYRIVFLQKKTDVSPLFVVRNIKMSLNEISN